MTYALIFPDDADHDAVASLDHGHEYPYDCDESLHMLKEDEQPKAGDWSPPKDWAHLAARGVIANLGDRQGIKHELDACDLEVRSEMIEALASIIRTAKLVGIHGKIPFDPMGP